MSNKERTFNHSPVVDKIIVLHLFLMFSITLASPVFAHKIYLFVWADGGTVYTEGYFSSKKKVKNGEIGVFDSGGKKLLTGRTNEEGEFSFKLPIKETDLRIVLDDTVGHRAEYNLKADEPKNIVEKTGETSETDKLGIPSPLDSKVVMEKVRIVVEETLDSRLRPILRALAKIQQEKSSGFAEIIGGIGYLFGIMGLVLYFKSRKKG